MQSSPDPQDILGAQGLLAQRRPGFEVRATQLAMSEMIQRHLGQTVTLLIEAGTGTGKTFAYLVPALQRAAKVMIATGTRHLQDQLFHGDLPYLMQMTGHRPSALLKGRANYLCHHRLAQEVEFYRKEVRETFADLDKIRRWASHTEDGDINTMTEVAEDAEIWPRVTSTTDNCLGAECPHIEQCFINKARQRAMDADVVVINHHLFFADAAVRDEGFAELLPQVDLLIFDEAHQLPDVASRFYGQSISARQILDLVRDGRVALQQEGGAARASGEIILDHLRQDLAAIREAMGTEGRGTFDQVADRIAVGAALLGEHLQALTAILAEVAASGAELERLSERCQSLAGDWQSLLQKGDGGGEVHWFEASKTGFILGRTPLHVDADIRALRQSFAGTWVLTSATLAIDGHFDDFIAQMGLQDLPLQQQVFASPFDYGRQSLLYVPRGLPQPNDAHYYAALWPEIRRLLDLSQGRAFLLFTSHRALREAEKALQDLPFPLFVQGRQPRHRLVQDFKEHGHGVLLGTGSFWEGVDVQGEALSLVVIDRIPFTSPADPLHEARIQAEKAAARPAFFTLQLPEAIMALKQGVGRLIRSSQDRGVMVIADPRLVQQPYAQQILQALPAMPRTRERERVGEFFRRMQEEGDDAPVGS